MIKLVIDGYATLYHLYFHNNFNCVCGGQYAQFAGECGLQARRPCIPSVFIADSSRACLAAPEAPEAEVIAVGNPTQPVRPWLLACIATR